MSMSLRNVIGIADCCEVLGVTWAFPTKELVDGIYSGALAHDTIVSLVDAGVAEAEAQSLVDAFQQACLAVEGGEGVTSQDALFEVMRHAYTRLYLTPGGKTPVAPFESAFLFDASGAHGVPTLFVSRTTVDVEACMREAGVVAKNARKEPADAIWNEFSYLAFLYGNLAQALQSEDPDAKDEWENHINIFLNKHALKWLLAFMEKTEVESEAYALPPIYSSLAKLSAVVLSLLKTV